MAAHAAITLSDLYQQQLKMDIVQSVSTNPNYSSSHFPNTAAICSTVPIKAQVATTNSNTEKPTPIANSTNDDDLD